MSGRKGASRCGGVGTRGPSAPRTRQEGPLRPRGGFFGHRPHPHCSHACFVSPHALWSLPSPTHPRTPLFLAYPTGRHPGSGSRPAPPTPGARDHRALLPERGQGSRHSQMAWGFPRIEIAAGSGPLKLLKGRDAKGRVRAHPTPPDRAPSPDPAGSDPGDPSSGEKALPVASKKRRETKILRLTVIPSSVPSSTFGVGLEQRLVKPHAQPLRPRPTLLARLLWVPDSPRGKGRESTFLSFFFPSSRWVSPRPSASPGTWHRGADCPLSLL